MKLYDSIFKHKYPLLIALSFFILLELIIFVTVQYKEDEDKATFLELKSHEFDAQVEIGSHYLDLIAQVLHHNTLDNTATAELMYKASQTDDLKKQAAIRAELYKKFQANYEYMKKLGVRQLHFHLPNAVSFLRFHRIEKFGDSLADVRESIMYVNKYKKPLECFEEGRIFNGFRHVYPIFYKKKFVGTVEISYSFRAFLEHMLEVNKNTSYLFLVNNNVIDNKVFQDEKSNYMRSAFKSYSIDKKTLNNRMEFSLNEIFSINKTIADEVSKKLVTKENFTVATNLKNLQNKSIVVSFIAVRNFEKKKVAYVVGYNYSATMDIIIKRSAQIFVLLSVLNFVVTLLIFILIIKEERKTARASEEAIRDPLTGILNRRGFDNMLIYKVSMSRRYLSDLSVIFFDIDHFKQINDTYGHDVGDIILKELTTLIKTDIRESDIFARWGGEEFIILLPMTSVSHAVTLAEKLQKSIRSYKFTQVDKLTCSFGVTEFQKNEEAQELLKRVDELLYNAKAAGRDKVISDTK